VSVAHSPDHVENQLILEIENVIKSLEPKETKRLLGFNKRQRAYICYECAASSGDCELRPKISKLVPNSPESIQVYCLVCDKSSPVIRRKCEQKGCKGNVIDADSGICLTCYS